MTAIRVLLAEAHQPLREALRRFLEGQGIEVVGEAASVEEVLRHASSQQPDVILVDVTSPRLDGFETSRQIKERLPGVKVVVVVDDDSSEEYRRVAQSSGASAYVTKGRMEKELLVVVRSILR